MINLKSKLTNGILTIGSWLSIANTAVCEMMARAGFDWLAIDMEHTSITEAAMFEMVQIVSLSGVAPLVRVGANNPLLIKRAMDCGATGVMVPMINNADDAKRAVESVYYFPLGSRGAGLYRAQGYGSGFSEYWSRQKEQFVTIAQIEHVTGVANIDEILAVDGIDGFIVGPYDLSASLGVPGELDHPKVLEALDALQARMTKGSKPGGYHIVHTDQPSLERRLQVGCRIIAYGGDMIFLSEKLAEITRQLKTVTDGLG